MRSVLLRIDPDQGWFGPFHRRVVETPDLGLEALHELRLLDDGSTVLLYEYSGDRAVAERLAEAHLAGSELEWQTAIVDGCELMYAHDSEPSEMLCGLLTLLDAWPVVVDWPIRFPTDDKPVVTIIGDEGEIRRGIEMVPEEIDVSVVRKGEYAGEPGNIRNRLTPSERETLETAVGLGHYRNPRDASYQDIADAMDCSTGTVGYHLRNAEAKIMTTLFGDGERERYEPATPSP